jgi:hypothetical protein
MPRATSSPINETPLLAAAAPPPQADQQQLDASVAVQSEHRSQPTAQLHVHSDESADTVKQWLSSHKLERYTEAVVEAGYGNLLALSTMSDVDQENVATAAKMKTPHARAFKQGIASLRGNATFTTGSMVRATAETSSGQATVVMAQPAPSTINGQNPATPSAAAGTPTGNVLHRRLAARAAAGNCSLAEQRTRDKLKHDQEAKCAGVWATFSCAALWIILQNTYCLPKDICPCSMATTCPGMVGCPTPTQCAGCGPPDGPYPGGCQLPPLPSCGKTDPGLFSCIEDGNAGTVIAIMVVAFFIKLVLYIRCMRVACRSDNPPWDSAIDPVPK